MASSQVLIQHQRCVPTLSDYGAVWRTQVVQVGLLCAAASFAAEIALNQQLLVP